MKKLIAKRLEELEKHFERTKLKSFDPYDGLNTPIRKLFLGNILLERIWLQSVRLFPVNIRNVVGVRKVVHTKSVSDLLSAFSILYKKTDEDKYFQKASECYLLLNDLKLKQANGVGWGLRFYFTTRFVQADERTPNLFQTVNALNSLLDYYELIKNMNDYEKSENVKNLIESAIKFIVKDLGYKESDNSIIWNYWKNLESPIYNVNALVIGFLSRCQKLFNSGIYKDYIRKTIEFIKEGQNEDGSWYYSADSKAKFIDGFHTGYILEGLSIAKINGVEVDANMFDKAVNYYLEHFFTGENLPKYYSNETYPIDGQNFAQALQTLHYLQKFNYISSGFIQKILEKADSVLWNNCGYYNYMKTKHFTYKTSMDRWVNTPVYLALSYLY